MSDTAPSGAADQYDQARVDALDERQAKLVATDEEITNGLRQAALDRANQNNDHRKRFVRWVIRIVTGTLLSSVVIMGLYVNSEWHEIHPPVMIAWFSATVVQTLGLAYVIAKHLFPASSGPEN